MSVGAARLAEIAAREGEIGLQHARHLVDVLLHRLDFRRFLLDQRQFELEAREHGAQVVRHAGQHRGALLDGALDARLHLDEGLRRAPHLARAARTEIRHFAALAETFGGVGQPQDRLDLVAQEDDGDADQHRRGADHPEQEDSTSSTHRRRCAARTPASRYCRAGRGFRPAPICRRCRSRTAARSACAAPPTASDRAARRTASAPAAACRSSGRKSTTRPSRSCAMRRICAASASCG